MKAFLVGESKYLVFEEEATQMLLATNVIGEDAARRLRSQKDQGVCHFKAAMAYSCYNLEFARLERGVSCKGCQVHLEVVGCDCDNRDQVFSTQVSLSHFWRCAEVQHFWAESDEGHRLFVDLEVTLRRGYLSPVGSNACQA
ncbi:hypothetical protein GGR52DRAFT_529869 [Hypoxylon sp. FL1284]|nr:hypothetical protein GGR52DRAFT_529869 [Hypoxylon sp. FL1284]